MLGLKWEKDTILRLSNILSFTQLIFWTKKGVHEHKMNIEKIIEYIKYNILRVQ